MHLAFREYGSGQPIIILHGLFGQSDNWNTIARQFSEQNLHVFTIDMRNHGLSPHSDVWNYEVMADDLKEFIEKQRIQDPIILGHSMGGKTAMFFDWKYPDASSRIIIADISPRLYEPQHSSVLKGLNAVDFSVIKTRKEVEARLSECIEEVGTKQFLLKNLYWKNAELDWRFNLKVITENIGNMGKEVPSFKSEIPCLLVRGERSEYVNENDLKDFKSRFSHFRFETIAGAGHWVHAEKPKEFFSVVLDFIKA